MKNYFEKLGIKVLKTMAQSAVGVIGASTLISQVDWRVVVSTVLLSGLVCILTNLSDLKEDDVDED
ncbi:holin [Streptococcus macedonicus]|uniref:Phage membrane protein n=1 Tax=Streptococcus gallolyticus TaxID=315405 RepID=A0A380JYL5_9STRE|nr:holin [Streptococcus macedonicus]WGK79937.1 holin [Streptococcus macedonicus]SUN56596.1 phage membrane protein [Streptococcus gallolyticus]SUN60189.1 phage membrane protein [Streptococcus gallolyticus]